MVIPKTLEECYVELKNIEGVEKWLKSSENTAMIDAHHGLGRWIRNNWGLWKCYGELYEWFISNEINHSYDMSNIILKSFYRHMKGQDIKLNEQIEYIVEYYLDDKQKLLRRRDKKLNKLNGT
jgi:hypothetical protein